MPAAINVGKPSATRGPWATRFYTPASGQTFVVGDWLKLNTSGQLEIAVAADNNIGSGVKLIGRAGANAADILALPAGERDCPVQVPGPTGEFVLAVYHGTPASAVIAETDMDAPPIYEFRNTATGWSADKSANTNKVVVLVERHLKYPYSEQYGWFWARIITSAKLHDSAA